MQRSEFLRRVEAGTSREDLWWPGPSMARALALHLHEEDEVLCWLQLARDVEPGTRSTALLTREKLLLVHCSGQAETGLLEIEVAPLRRLRAVRFLEQRYQERSQILLSIDFDGPVFRARPGCVHVRDERNELICCNGALTREVEAFLSAIYQAWR